MADQDPSFWDQAMEALRASTASADESNPKGNAFVNPAAKNAQARATQYYFRTGEQLPLDSFMKNPNLK